jgi:hypothetical protein
MSGVTSGIKYIKINRLDTNGKDYGPQIRAANNIRINYSDIGPVQYDILTTQQQADYYLLGIIPQPVTSSTNKILDYRVEAITFPASDTINNSLISLNDIVTNAGVWDVVYNNSLQYFISQAGDPYFSYYSLGNTPNIPLTFTISGSVQNGTGESVNLFFYLVNYNNIDTYLTSQSVVIVNGGPTTFRISLTTSGSLTQPEGTILGFFINSSDTLTLSPSNQPFRFIVTSSRSSTSPPSSLINISPDTFNFSNSDENALYNNATIPKYSNIYQDIDYSTGLVPTNFDLLISGNADAAPVQDSNYTSTGWSNSRYNGSRVSSLDFNI